MPTRGVKGLAPPSPARDARNRARVERYVLAKRQSQTNNTLTTHGLSDWFKRCPRDEKGHCDTGGGGGAGPGQGYMAGVDKTFSDPMKSETVKKLLDGEAEYDLHHGLPGGREDRMLTDIMKEAGRADTPRMASKEEVDKLVKEGWYSCYRGVGEQAHADQFAKGEMYNGAGISGNGTYTAYKGGGMLGSVGADAKARAEVEKYARGGRGPGSGAVSRIAFPKDAKIVDHETVKSERNKYQSELTGKLEKGEITREHYNKMSQVIEDVGRFAALKNYDAIAVKDSGYLNILNRSKCVVQSDPVERPKT